MTDGDNYFGIEMTMVVNGEMVHFHKIISPDSSWGRVMDEVVTPGLLAMGYVQKRQDVN